MSQCVPSWELDDSLAPFNFTMNSSNSLTTADTPSLDYEVTELTWENGQLAVHGLAPPPRVVGKASASQTTWDKPRAGGTLESIVNQATRDPHPKSAAHGGGVNELVPWFNHHHAFVNPAASATMTMDALVPCNNNGAIRRKDINKVHENSSSHMLDSVPGVGTCMVGSCSGASTGGLFARAGPCCCRANPAVSESATCGTGGDSRQVTLDSCERDFGGGGGMTSTSLWSPENTSSGKEDTKTSGDDHDSICHSRPQKREAGEKSKRKGSGKSPISAKSRAAAIHNQSERKRRDKINQRMKTLQKLVPNSSKTDKASMLDEVIEYLKQLQAQVHMMGRMNMPNMMMSFMQQQLHMNMMAQAMGMGTMGVMDIGRPTMTPPIIPTTAATNAGYMPWDIQGGDRMHVQPIMPDVLSTFLASQSHPQPMTVDGYTKLAALYQQFQQPSAGSGSKN